MENSRRRWVLLAIVYALAFAANVGHFWWSWPVGVLQLAATLLYAAVCVWVFWSLRRRRNSMRLAAWTGGLTAAAGAVGLLIRAGTAWLTLPGLLLAGFFATPLYGVLGWIPDFDALYAVLIFLGLVWLGVSLRLFRRAAPSPVKKT